MFSREEPNVEQESLKIEKADSLANIKRGGLILPSKKRLNIRKRPNEDLSNGNRSSDDDDANNAPASKIREMQYLQHMKAVGESENSSNSKKRHDVDLDSNSDKSDDESSAESAGGSAKNPGENEQASATQPQLQAYKPLPQVVLKDPEVERRELLEKRMKKIVALFKRRNTEESIAAARERYFLRKLAGSVKPDYYKE